MNEKEAAYLDLLLQPIRVCAKYRPKFGQGSKKQGLTLAQFQKLYQSDPFYSWFGLDNPLMYAAHKAAGGMTSVYRQIGIGCERLFRAILKDALKLSDEDVSWSYQVTLPSGKTRTLYLDARIPLDKIADQGKSRKLHNWMSMSAKKIGVDKAVFRTLKGVVLRLGKVTKARIQSARTLILPTPRQHILKHTFLVRQYFPHKLIPMSLTAIRPRSGLLLLALRAQITL